MKKKNNYYNFSKRRCWFLIETFIVLILLFSNVSFKMKNEQMNQGITNKITIKSKLSKLPEYFGTQLAVKLDSTVLHTFSISIVHVSADVVVIKYNGIPGNLPKNLGNYVAIWPQTVIPWGAKPLEQKTLLNNDESSTVTLSGMTLSASSYIIGYANGPNESDIVASASINAGGSVGIPAFVNIGLDYVGTNSIAINYHTLSGYQPATHGNWVGIWRGEYSPYSNNTPPEGFVKIPKNYSEGSVGIDNITLGINTEYTVVYFMGKEYSRAAAILNFNTADFITKK